jgi:hypothetical protein
MPLSSRYTPIFAILTVLVAACGDQPVPQAELALAPIRDFRVSGATGRQEALLQLPVYLRTDYAGRLLTLDTSRKAAVLLATERTGRSVAGRPGRGPGEISVALGMDVADDGSVWIADPGNGKLAGFRDGVVVAEFLVDHQPLGVTALRDGSVWVGGDLMNSVLVRYDRKGNRLGTAGVPPAGGARAFRLNQGVMARGTGPCAVVWAYTFHSRVECYAADGRTLWSVRGPVEIEPGRDVDPYRMSPDDRFAYVDVTTAGDEVFALFVGRKAGDDGLRTREVHVFRVADGGFAGRMELPEPAKFILRRNVELVALDYDPEPMVRSYRIVRRTP